MFFVALERERERKHRSVVHSKQREKKERRTKRTVTLPDFPERESNRFLLLFSSMIFGRRSSTPNSSSGFVRFFVFAILLLSATERKGKRNGHIFTSKRGDFSPRCDVIKKNAHLFTHTHTAHTLAKEEWHTQFTDFALLSLRSRRRLREGGKFVLCLLLLL